MEEKIMGDKVLQMVTLVSCCENDYENSDDDDDDPVLHMSPELI